MFRIDLDILKKFSVILADFELTDLQAKKELILILQALRDFLKLSIRNHPGAASHADLN